MLAECGVNVHLAHPLGNNWGHRRVKNDERDATDLVDLLRMGRLAEAWIAPAELRELRELIRYRAKLVHLRTGLKAQVHAVLAKEGVSVPMTDLFGAAGRALLDSCPLADAYALRVRSLRELIDVIGGEITMLGDRIDTWLSDDVGYHAIQAIPGVGPVLAAVFVAEVGDVSRFPTARHLASWAGLTPSHPRVRHHRAPRPHHQARVTAGALGGGRGRAAPAWPDRHPSPPSPGGPSAGQEHRAGGGRPQARHPRLLRLARRRDPLPGPRRGVTPGPDAARCELAVCHGPRHRRRGRALD